MSDERQPRERARKPSSRYSIFVGLAFLIVIVVATANTLRTRDDGILGTSETDRGDPLPEFAVPDLRGASDADANVFQDDCASAANPCPTDDQRTPACEIDVSDAIRVCDLFDRPLVISFWFTQGADCLPTQDVVDRVAARFRGQVNFLSINVRDDRDAARKIVDERGWRVPVGWDADGAVSNLYRVGVCPTVAFAYPGGIFSGAKLGSDELSAEQLTADVERLQRESRRRASQDR
jgi:hypothetical protein